MGGVKATLCALLLFESTTAAIGYGMTKANNAEPLWGSDSILPEMVHNLADYKSPAEQAMMGFIVGMYVVGSPGYEFGRAIYHLKK